MVHTDSTSPLPPPIKKDGSRKKRILYILLPLFLINAGVASLLINQIDLSASNKAPDQVKDESVIISSEKDAKGDNLAEVAIVANDQPVITSYTIKEGDTLSGIATKFNISVNTIRWANDLTAKSVLKPGEDLTILPVTGIEYTVKKGDTISGIALKFDASQTDILYYNDIEETAIKVGMKIIIPEAEPLPVAVKKVTTPTKPVVKSAAKTTTEKTETKVTKKSSNRFSNPVPGAVLTQRIHDGNAVDFGLAVGSPVLAAAAGKVIISKSGYNGGYGTYVVITHNDGSQTLYAHLSKLSVAVGDTVSQGERIGSSGNTGRSTGPHLHYKEISTGSKNTFATLPLH